MPLPGHAGGRRMKRRSRAGGKPVKALPSMALKLKGRKAPKPVSRPALSPSGQETEVVRLTRERDAALEQQTATSEVLHVISTSRGELEPVFHIMLERAVRICEAKFGALYRFDGNALLLAAHREIAEFRASRGSFQPTPDGLLDRVLRTKRVNYVAAPLDVPAPRARELSRQCVGQLIEATIDNAGLSAR
jgi:hypothetical protein